MSFSLGLWLARASPKKSRSGSRRGRIGPARMLGHSTDVWALEGSDPDERHRRGGENPLLPVRTKAEAVGRFAAAGRELEARKPPRCSFYLASAAPTRSRDVPGLIRRRSEKVTPKGRVTDPPGRASVLKPVNNLILNFWASGVWLLFNSRGRPRRTRTLRALIVSAIPTRRWRPRKWNGPGIGSGAFHRPRSRDPLAPSVSSPNGPSKTR